MALDLANTAHAGHFTDLLHKKCWLYLSGLFTATTTATTAPAAISSKRFSDCFDKIKEKRNE